MSPGESAEVLLDKLAALVNGARQRVAEGKRVELTALTAKVAELQAAIAAVPPIESETLKARLGLIIDGLDRLADALTDQHRGLAAETDSTRLRAARVYGPANPKPDS